MACYNEVMKRMFLALALLISFFAVAPVSAADVNNFYFSDFTGDYYLTKDEDGISHLKVKERRIRRNKLIGSSHKLLFFS